MSARARRSRPFVRGSEPRLGAKTWFILQTTSTSHRNALGAWSASSSGHSKHTGLLSHQSWSGISPISARRLPRHLSGAIRHLRAHLFRASDSKRAPPRLLSLVGVHGRIGEIAYASKRGEHADAYGPRHNVHHHQYAHGNRSRARHGSNEQQDVRHEGEYQGDGGDPLEHHDRPPSKTRQEGEDDDRTEHAEGSQAYNAAVTNQWFEIGRCRVWPPRAGA